MITKYNYFVKLRFSIQKRYTGSMTNQTRKSLALLVVLVAVLIVGILVFKPQRSAIIQQQPQAVDTAVDEQIIADTTENWIIDVKYPQFVGVSQEFNDSIKRAATLDIESFKKGAIADRQARLDTAMTPEERADILANPWQYGYQAEYTIIQNNDRYISVLMHQSGFNGGAHGYDVIHTFNYDRAQDKIMALADMYPNDPDYLASLSKIAREQLQVKLGEYYAADMAEPGTEPTAENFNAFTFTDGKITIYFQQYQVGPYAVGQQTVEIDR